MKEFPFVSIILVNYNGMSYIEKCFSTLRKTKYPKDKYEIFMVDNNSADGSINFVKNNFPEVKVIETGKNLGWAEGNNVGVQASSGIYVTFLNVDTIVEPEWLFHLVWLISQKDDIGAVCSKIRSYDNPKVLSGIGGFWSLLGVPGAFGRGSKFSDFKKPVELFSPTGACMIMNKEFLIQIGLFDSDFFLYTDDAEIGWRIWNFQKKCIFHPKSVIHHKDRGSGLASELYYYYNTRNRLWAIIKNSRRRDVLWMLSLSCLSSLIQGLYFIIKQKSGLAKATFKGTIDAFTTKGFFKMVQKRRNIPKCNKPYLHMLGFKSSIDILSQKIIEHG
jgi:hypothetical protein